MTKNTNTTKNQDKANTDLNIKSVSPLYGDDISKRAYEKTERLTLATYMITNLVPLHEGGVQDIRMLTRKLLHKVMQLRFGITSAGPLLVPEIISIVREVLSLLDLLHVGGYISDMNTRILKLSYKNFIVYITDSFNEENKQESASLSGYVNTVDDLVSQDKKQPQNNTKIVTNKSTKNIKSYPNPRLNSSVKTRAKSDERRAQIIDLISIKGNITMSDVREKLPKIGAKTLQRDLLALVSDGVVEKKGEKRWSVYSIARSTAI